MAITLSAVLVFAFIAWLVYVLSGKFGPLASA